MIFNIGESVYFKVQIIDVKTIPTKHPIFLNGQNGDWRSFQKEKLNNNGQ
jgi:hypothetical protein